MNNNYLKVYNHHPDPKSPPEKRQKLYGSLAELAGEYGREPSERYFLLVSCGTLEGGEAARPVALDPARFREAVEEEIDRLALAQHRKVRTAAVR